MIPEDPRVRTKVERAEEFLLNVIGPRRVKDYEAYLFEYASQEASFLQLRATGEDTYQEAFEGLCRLRRNEGLLSLQELLEQVAHTNNWSYERVGQEANLIFAPYEKIPALIHQGYYPPKTTPKLPPKKK